MHEISAYPQWHENILVFCKAFIDLPLIYRSTIYLESIFYKGLEVGSQDSFFTLSRYLIEPALFIEKTIPFPTTQQYHFVIN